MSSRKVLVTGVRGFTGVHMVRELERNGYEVIGVDRQRRDGDTLVSHACDIGDPDDVKRLIDQTRPDYLVHLAGIAHVAHGDPHAFFRVNLFGAINMIEAMAALGMSPSKLLFPSSANVYGAAAQAVLDESICPRPVNYYGSSKLAMEHQAANWFDRLPIVIARPFNYTGPGQDSSFVIPKIIGHFQARKPRIDLGNIEVEREFNDVRDVCRNYRLLLESDLTGAVVNVCSGVSHSLRSILDQMTRIAGYRIEIDVNPALVRSNEIPRLMGSNARLHAAIGQQPYRSIGDTLSWMYETNV